MAWGEGLLNPLPSEHRVSYAQGCASICILFLSKMKSHATAGCRPIHLVPDWSGAPCYPQ